MISPSTEQEKVDEAPAPGRLPAFVAILRPHQWVKNLLILLPLLLAHQVTNIPKLMACVLAFWAASFCASSVYILNDLLDVESDRRHPSKRLRPFAAGTLSPSTGLFIAAVMLTGAIALTLTLPWRFGAMLLVYLLVSVNYSLWLKRRMLLDAMALAGLYTFRILEGAFAVQVQLTMWLLAFSMFFFLSLAFVKRYSELIQVEHSGGQKLRGRGYHVSDLRIIEAVGPASGYLSVLVFCNYLDSQLVRTLYARPNVLWLVAPLLLYWITRIWFVARRRLLHDDPIIYAISDRVSLMTGALVTVVVLAAWLKGPPWLPF
jgi:4-hydroxybenzoate polyprenyltransferase